MSADDAGADGELLVRFTTSVDALRVPSAAIGVPGNLNRAGLSQIIDHLLGKSGSDEDAPPAYEFFLPQSQLSEIASRQAKAKGVDVADIRLPASSLLRTSLRKFLRSYGLGPEDTVTLEYAPALTPPTPGPTATAQDWVSALAVSDSVIVAGCYDGCLYAAPAEAVQSWTAASGGGSGSGSGSAAAEASPAAAADVTALLGAAMPAHAMAITGVSLFEKPGVGIQCATAGSDGVVALWAARPTSTSTAADSASKRGSSGSKASRAGVALSAVAVLEGAQDACGDVGIDPSGNVVACGDGKGSVMVWSTSSSSSSSSSSSGADAGDEEGEDGGGAGAQRPAKRARAGSDARSSVARATATASSSGGSGSGAGVEHRQPLQTVSGRHTAAVSSVSWLSATSLVSGSWDHSCVVWDVEAAFSPVHVVRCGKVVTAVTASPMGSVMATGHPDNKVRVWDSRSRSGGGGGGGGDGAAGGLRVRLEGSTGWVSRVAWCPTSSHHIAATSHTGDVMLWDLRAPAAPLYTTHKHDDKALCVAWWGSGSSSSSSGGAAASGLVSGGADKRVRTAKVHITA